jgi:hypothetical protein
LSDLSDVEMEPASESDDEPMPEKVDIRALVGKGRKADPGPPAKKQRKA